MPTPDFTFNPQCVATTGGAFNRPVQKNREYDDQRSNLFRRARFSPDGTAIVTQNEDHCLRTFVLPEDLLEQREEPQNLEPHCHFRSGSNLQSFDIYPHFNLRDPSTTLVLSASTNVPITLRNALHYETIHAHYPFVNTQTEEHCAARSLSFTSSGRHFIAGSLNVIAAFDVSRNDGEPISKYVLRPGKETVRLDTSSLTRRGWVSSMNTSNDRVLAMGTNQREIALFEQDGLGQCMSAFSLETHEGTGITGLRWSPDGRYLLVAERSSDCIQVFDIRGTGQEVGRLIGRKARTTQVLDFNVVPTMDGFEVWAGGTDGRVRMWSNPASQEGMHVPDAEFEMHQSPVSSAVWHHSGVVLATCSGERYSYDESDGEGDSDDDHDHVECHEPDNTLKIWTV